MPKHDLEVMHISGESVHPGDNNIIQLPMPQLYECSPMYMPIYVVRDKKPGPTLLLTAAIHGDELNGVEIIRRILKVKTLKQLAGTLIAVPIANVYGFLYQSRYLMDPRFESLFSWKQWWFDCSEFGAHVVNRGSGSCQPCD